MNHCWHKVALPNKAGSGIGYCAGRRSARALGGELRATTLHSFRNKIVEAVTRSAARKITA